MTPFTMYRRFLGIDPPGTSGARGEARLAAIAATIELRSPLAGAYSSQYWSRLVSQQLAPNLNTYAAERAAVRPLGTEPLPHAMDMIVRDAEAAIVDAVLLLRGHPAFRDPREGRAAWPDRLQLSDWRCFLSAVYASIAMADESDPLAPVWREAKKVLDGNIAVLAVAYPDDDFTPQEVHTEWHVIIRNAANQYGPSLD
ncbi:MAG TPA: hypothetical protein VJM32_03605 [Candidatus Saccharimonadales bacterium]|nr:hypothetical protein [Candidatus Saccharimonadales bacterium]